MMALLIVTILSLLAVFAGKFIRKNNVKIYVIATILAIAAFIFQDVPVFKPILQGFIGFSLFYVVMVTGALKKKSKLSTKLAGIRREYSIIGFILISPHALKYLFQMLDGSRNFEWFGIIAYAIMLPLFVTSFMTIRKKMSRKSWVNLQRFAYIAYILLFIHLILNASTNQNLVAYLIMFIPYIIFKLIKEYKKYFIKKD